ncbi:DUF1427 family protein [Streptomyces collinus]|uniref:DUF1427 family protein n=1 Tax=Streptomyces collinus TaxID=42684 RepID=UPI002941CC94|nr:DUF1427 family protein [Streptomyces collinus]
MNPAATARRPGGGPVLRAVCVSLGAGLPMGAAYALLGLAFPAPPLIGLTGLFGIVLGGERATTALRSRRERGRRRAAPGLADPAGCADRIDSATTVSAPPEEGPGR